MSALDVEVVRSARQGPRRRRRRVVGGLTVVLVVAFAGRVLLGDYTVTVPDFLRIVLGEDIPVASFIVMESKLPRAVLAVLVGLALGSAGAVFQTLLRNPLASPDVIGVSLGASAAGVIALLTFGLRGMSVSIAAIAGAAGVALLVRWTSGGIGGSRLVLIGVALSAAMLAAIHYVIARAVIYDAQLALRWLTGSLNDASWARVAPMTLALVVLLPTLAWLARGIPALELGEDTAVGLGARTRRPDALLLVAVLLVGAAVAVAGPVAFVAFMAGPIARALNAGRTSILGAALVGATVMVAADHVAAYLIPGLRLPVGVVTGAVGGPFLLWLLARSPAGGRAT